MDGNARLTLADPHGEHRRPRAWSARAQLGTSLGLIVALAACATAPGRSGRAAEAASVEGELEPAREASESGDWPAAAERWLALFEANGPHARQACLEAVRAQMAMGELEEARALLEAGLERYPGDAELYEVKGNVLHELGFRRAAESCYEEALRHEPGRNSALFARARLRLELGLAAAARVDLERCLQQGERGGELWLCYARSLCATRHPRRAFDAFARAFELGEQDPRCLVAASALYFDPEFAPRTAHERDLSALWLQRAIAMDPDDAQARYWLALVQEERGELDAAVLNLSRVLELDRANLAALSRLAELLHRRGEWTRAAELARKALELERRPARREALETLLAPPQAAAHEKALAGTSTSG